MPFWLHPCPFSDLPSDSPSNPYSDAPIPTPTSPLPACPTPLSDFPSCSTDFRLPPSDPFAPGHTLTRPTRPQLKGPKMARGRVPPENRRRSQRACSFCRMSKKRCDGASPCHNCARRGRQATCVYTRYGSERSEGPPRAAAVPPAANADNALSGRSTVETADSSYLTPDGGDTARSDPSSCSQYMHPRMLRNGTEGEKGGPLACSELSGVLPC